jgi:hypothetical protein
MSLPNDNVLFVPNRNVLLTTAGWGVGNGPTPDDRRRSATGLVALKKTKKKLINQKQAAAEIGVSEQQVRRMLQELREHR